MKIVEKKCPNCHANLEFDVGEQNVKCPSCRRAFAIEYDKDFVDPEVQLKAKDIQLKMLDDFSKARSFNKVFFIVVLVIAAIIFCATIFLAIDGYKEYKDTKNDIETSEEEWRARQKAEDEKYEQKQKEVEDAIKEQIEKQSEQY